MPSKVLLPRPYPRVVAHRGFSKACPENTMPAFGAAVAMGADEIELDVWPSADGELVVMHDPSLDRTTTKSGNIKETSWSEIVKADAGTWHGEAWRGVRVPRLEDVWDAFAGQIEFNVHIKDPGEEGMVIRRIKKLAEQHGISEQIYIAGDHDVMKDVLQYAPEISRCCLAGQGGWNLVDFGMEYQCRRVQFPNKYCNQKQIKRAHDAGIICNLFYADEPDVARQFLDIGIDSILTNALAEVLPIVKEKQ